MHRNNAGRPAPLFFRIASALVLLFFPFLVAAGFYFVRPGWLMQLFYRYTGIPEYTSSAPLDSVFLPRLAIETLSRVWHVLFESLLIIVLLILPAVLLKKLTKKYVNVALSARIWACLGFGCCAWSIGWIAWPDMVRVTAWAIVITIGYCLTFSEFVGTPFGGGARRLPVFLVIGAPVGFSHFFMPAHLLALILYFLSPRSVKLEEYAVFLGRTVYCIFSVGIATLVFLSAKPIPISPQVKLLLAGRNLYDLEVDPVTQSLLVTNKYAEYKYPCYALSIENPDSSPRTFVIPSFEVEDIVMDVPGRKFYHVNRFQKQLLCMDADSLEFLWAKNIFDPGSGSAALALDADLSKVIILWENNYLSVVDLESGQIDKQKYIGKGATMTYDGQNKRIYLHHGSPHRIEALDLFALETLRSAPAPEPDRMVICFSRKELYISDAIHGRIWIYELPSLKLIRRIPCQFGVRALAVDETNRILFAAGSVSGQIQLFHLDRGTLIGAYRIGGISRQIAVDHRYRYAFVTTIKKGLYVLKY